MRTITGFACLSLATMLAACGPNSDGYYDDNGRYIPYHDSKPYDSKADRNSNRDMNRHSYDHTRADYNRTDYNRTDYNRNAYSYDLPGYYDYSGRYSATNEGLAVPQTMFPPRGMCRVWFTDRPVVNQPPVEACDNIRSRAPAGSYVIYGG